jgi:predicted DsbA family dithiol-disulfide isomerase
MDAPMKKLAIDVVSDVVCPWCYIGKKRMEQALAARPDLEVELTWRPFQLDHTIPREGIARDEYLMKKFGSAERISAIFERIREAGRAEGLAFAFEKIRKSPNTIDAHRVIRWAGEAGVQSEVKERIMRGYFMEGADLTDIGTLAALAGEAGMVADQVANWLATDEDRDAVSAEVAHAQRIGIHGVPFFILANKIGVSGAQTPDVLHQAFDQALAAA